MNKFDRMVRRAKEKESKPKKKPKEYRYQGHYTEHLIFVPLIYFVAWYEVVRDSCNRWTPERTERILTYALPKVFHINTINDSLYLEMDKNYWGLSWTWYCGFFDKYYCYKYNKEISEYFKERFYLDGYEKSVEEYDDDDCFIVRFKKETS